MRFWTDNSVFRNIDIYMGTTYNGFVGALLGEGGNTTAETLNDVNVYNVKQDRLQYIVRNQDNVENYAKFTGLTIYTDEGTTKYKFITAETVGDEFIAEKMITAQKNPENIPKAALIVIPVCSILLICFLIYSSSPSDLSFSQYSAVRRHCQTMALYTGSPVFLSHTMVVSR